MKPIFSGSEERAGTEPTVVLVWFGLSSHSRRSCACKLNFRFRPYAEIAAAKPPFAS
jgi:hypothetical protein